ncbi:MAG: 2,3-bisphosphoglycerate-dependent phosphoglycerate mutase [Chlamydiia bacterium]
MSKLILIRHAESLWNKENRFTGDIDVGLSLTGIFQALSTADQIPGFSVVYTSGLFRCKMTAALLLAMSKKLFSFSAHQTAGIDVHIVEDKRLNERDYGELKGKNKQETLEEFGREQFHKWRRGYKDRPPGGESLYDVELRVKDFLETRLLSDLREEKDVLLVAHGNSLRALVKVLEGMGDEEVVDLEIPLMNPRIYEMKNGGFVRLKGP